jgi:hypothetical protein
LTTSAYEGPVVDHHDHKLTGGSVTGSAAFNDEKVARCDVDLGHAGSHAENDLTGVDPSCGNEDPFAGRGFVDCRTLRQISGEVDELVFVCGECSEPRRYGTEDMNLLLFPAARGSLRGDPGFAAPGHLRAVSYGYLSPVVGPPHNSGHDFLIGVGKSTSLSLLSVATVDPRTRERNN